MLDLKQKLDGLTKLEYFAARAPKPSESELNCECQRLLNEFEASTHCKYLIDHPEVLRAKAHARLAFLWATNLLSELQL